jgi:hypothetical protein
MQEQKIKEKIKETDTCCSDTCCSDTCCISAPESLDIKNTQEQKIKEKIKDMARLH